MTKLEQKLEEYRLYKGSDPPTYLYIGTEEKRALQKKLERECISGQRFMGLEIVLVQRLNFLEVG